LAFNWDSLYKLNKLYSSDKGFKAFVLKLLVPADMWEIIIRNATNKCPSEMQDLCKDILKRNDSIMKDIEKDKKQGEKS